MNNSKDFENKFFTYLQKQFSKNDFIKINESFVPNRASNRINRFYSNENSIWFSRLKISDKEKIYYFGIMDSPSPKALIKFNIESMKSAIKFTKNGEVLFLVKIVDTNTFNEINDLFTLKYASKDKTSGNYFLVLGKLNSDKLIKNIKSLIKNFNFIMLLKNNKLIIDKYVGNSLDIEIGDLVESTDYVSILKSNLKVVEIENLLLTNNFQYGTCERLKSFLFSKTSDDDYYLNLRFKNNFKLSDNEIYDGLIRVIPTIDNSLSYEAIVDELISNIIYLNEGYSANSDYSNESLTELEKMKIVLNAIKENKTDIEAAKLAGISEDKIFEWYEDGENSLTENTIYFFNGLNEILFVSEDDEINQSDSQPIEEFNEVKENEMEINNNEEFNESNSILQSSDESENYEGFNLNFDNETGGFIGIKKENAKILDYGSPDFKAGRDIYKEAQEKFPLKSPRPDQLEIISEVIYAINNGYKYIIIEAGTGAGKSAIAATLARIYENSYILTVTKQLQNQYYNDFKKYGFSLVTGRQNFNCIHHKDISCDKGDCVLKNKSCDYNLTGSNPLEKLKLACKDYYWKSDKHCPYWTQKVKGLNSKVTIANYDFGLYDFNLSHYFKKRKLLILDEAHNLENKIMSFISLDLNKNTLKKDIGLHLDFNTIDILQKGNARDWINFVKKIKEKYDNRAKSLINEARANGEDEGFIKDLEKELKIESANRERFINYISNDKKNWICDYDSRNEIISFKPLSVKNYTNDYLFGFGDVCIFMSATILNHRKFAQWMGINYEEVYSIRKDSRFNSSDNPIIIKDSYNMSRAYLKDSAPKTIPVLNEILAKHKNEKGLIHTVSNDCRRYIMKNINNNRLMTHSTKNRDKKLEEYKSSKNSVLVSPSMSEGVDLPGEQCRFQVIYKLPFMTLSEQVRQRVDEDEEWYDYRTCISLVQTFGRGIRFDGDYCTTYVVDSRFKEFIRKDKREHQFIPDYVLDAIK